MLTDEFMLGTKLYRKQLMELCEPMAHYFGTTHAIYFNVDKQGRAYSVCTDVRWIERFLDEQYYIVDPLMVHPANIQNGFAFDEDSSEQGFTNTLLYDAVVKFDCNHSFCYMEKTTEGGYFGVSFATTKDNIQIVDRVKNESHIVKGLIQALNQKIIHMTRDLQDNAMDFAALKGDAFYSQKGLVFNAVSDDMISPLGLKVDKLSLDLKERKVRGYHPVKHVDPVRFFFMYYD
jgi:hypothetical protein